MFSKLTLSDQIQQTLCLTDGDESVGELMWMKSIGIYNCLSVSQFL